MKKFLAILLSLIMILSVSAPAFAAAGVENIPTIMLRGDGTQIYVTDENGNEINVWGDSLTGINKDEIAESVANVLLPFLTEGLLFDEWDNYYQAFYDEVSPIFENLRLDENGNPRYGSGIGKDDLKDIAYTRSHNRVNGNGSYGIHSYTYWYDWRLSPLEVIDELHQYILDVMAVTKKNKVNIVGSCLGGSYVLAYLEKYGQNGHIKNVFFNVTVGNGTVLLTDAFCGDIEINDKAIQRFGYQNVDLESNSFAGFFESTELINELIFASYDLLSQVGVIDQLGLAFDELYQKIYEGLVPRLAIAIYATMPGYWSTVETDRYEEAIKFVFGEKGDELYDEYEGLIAKLDDYYNTVSKNKEKIISDCQAKGIHFGAMVKYGVQMYPFVESQDQLSDELVDVKNASFGATVAKDVFSKFSDDYINEAKKNGTDKYISPDRQIDTSTSIFKDTLWVQKNVNHDRFLMDDQVITEFCRHTNYNINSDPAYPQFMIYIPGTMEPDLEDGGYLYDTGDIVPMTEENCELTLWDEMPEDAKQEEPTLLSRLMALFRFLTAMFKYLIGIIDEKPVLAQ